MYQLRYFNHRLLLIPGHSSLLSNFPLPFTRTHHFTANEKDFSTSLEMTIREGLFVILRAALGYNETASASSKFSILFYICLREKSQLTLQILQKSQYLQR